MKMVKSLLLGAAAGLVAMTGAQAADLPVKAKPVQYVKICSLYGAGFYYIPGTDTCIKMGGFLRAEWSENASGSFATNTNGANGLYTRASDTQRARARGIMTWDVRSQTEYGTLRSYMRAGWQWTTSDIGTGGSAVGGAAVSTTTYLDRAFIQIAGFTFGKTQSFYDFFNTPGYSYMTNQIWMDTGGSGTPVIAYTAQFGSGLSATLSIEDHSEQALPGTAVGAGGLTGAAGPLAGAANVGSGFTAGNKVPDLVGDLRVDQPWGSAQVMGALHNNSATYYPVQQAGNTMQHPSDVVGWALGAGILVNLPMLGAGDNISVAGSYCSGATRYCSAPAGGARGSDAMFGILSSNTMGAGWADDFYFNSTAATGGSLELARSWSVMGGLSHNWNPMWNTTLYAGYLDYKANSNTVDTLVCALVPVGFGGPRAAGCMDYQSFQIGSRTEWKPVSNLSVGLEVLYTGINGAFNGVSATPGWWGITGVGTPAANIVGGNTGVWSGVFRVQRNFWP